MGGVLGREDRSLCGFGSGFASRGVGAWAWDMDMDMDMVSKFTS